MNTEDKNLDVENIESAIGIDSPVGESIGDVSIDDSAGKKRIVVIISIWLLVIIAIGCIIFIANNSGKS